MPERSIVITEKDGNYQIHNSILNEFELLGLFKQIVFDLKYSKAGKSSKENDQKSSQETEQAAEMIPPLVEPMPTAAPTIPAATEEKTPKTNVAPERIAGVSGTAAIDLRTRIGNAVKAIRDLGGRVETSDLAKMTDEELQTELEELTAQYKRLKNSKGK